MNEFAISLLDSHCRNLYVSELADAFILQGAFGKSSVDEMMPHIEEFTRRLLAIYRLPHKKLSMAPRLIRHPITYSYPNLQSANLFSINFLEHLNLDIKDDLISNFGQDEHTGTLFAEAFGWRIACLVAIYHHCDQKLPSDAYRRVCIAVPASPAHSDPPIPLSRISPLITAPDHALVEEIIIEEARNAKRSMRDRLRSHGMDNILINFAIQNYSNAIASAFS